MEPEAGERGFICGEANRISEREEIQKAAAGRLLQINTNHNCVLYCSTLLSTL